MYTVVIADDERELRNAIVRTIDWNAIGFNIIGEAENGMEALELIEELEPDLLLTDIRIPFMTGIELAREARKLRPVMDIVFISGYDDFEYAQQAIEYNIISYLLKPLSAAEMTQEMISIRKKMDIKFERMKVVHELSDFQEKKSSYEKTLFLMPLLLDGVMLHTIGASVSEIQNIEIKAKELGIRKISDTPVEYEVMVTAFLIKDKKTITDKNHLPFVDTIIQKYVNCTSIFSNDKIITIISDTRRNIEKYTPIFSKEIIQGSERIRQQKCEIGISNLFTELKKANNAYIEAVTACDYAFGESSEPRFISDVESLSKYVTRPMDNLMLEFERQLQTGDEKSMEEYLDKILFDSEIGNNEFILMQLVSTIYAVLNSVPEDDNNKALLNQLSLSERNIMNSPPPKVKENIRIYANVARDIIANQRKQSSQLVCEQAIQIINREYTDENLKLSSISQRLHISTSYLSALIKRECGESFVNLLTEKRMKVAKESLLCSSKKMVEIATECGYSDHHYFSYCFKKYYGMSPNKMRESVRNG